MNLKNSNGGTGKIDFVAKPLAKVDGLVQHEPVDEQAGPLPRETFKYSPETPYWYPCISIELPFVPFLPPRAVRRESLGANRQNKHC